MAAPRDSYAIHQLAIVVACCVAFTPGPDGGRLAGQPRDAAVADLVLRGGPVITVDSQDRVASAVAIAGNRIVAVGGEQDISGLVGPRTRVVDLVVVSENPLKIGVDRLGQVQTDITVIDGRIVYQRTAGATP